MDFLIRSSSGHTQSLLSCIRIIPAFISVAEELKLETEVSRLMRKKEYEMGHFDNAICNYREIMISDPSRISLLPNIAAKVMELCPSISRNLLPIHVLDLAPDGIIKPHIDNVNLQFAYLLALRGRIGWPVSSFGL